MTDPWRLGTEVSSSSRRSFRRTLSWASRSRISLKSRVCSRSRASGPCPVATATVCAAPLPGAPHPRLRPSVAPPSRSPLPRPPAAHAASPLPPHNPLVQSVVSRNSRAGRLLFTRCPSNYLRPSTCRAAPIPIIRNPMTLTGTALAHSSVLTELPATTPAPIPVANTPQYKLNLIGYVDLQYGATISIHRLVEEPATPRYFGFSVLMLTAFTGVC